MKSALLLLTCVIYQLKTIAQPYISEKTRHRFAQLNFGADVRTFIENGAVSYHANQSGGITSFNPGSHTEMRLIVGGTHFWGHADFYVAFPVASFGRFGFFSSVETGAKAYPWAIQQHKLRPYAGVSYLVTSYQQGQGGTLMRNKLPILAGVTWYHRQQLFDFGITYSYNNACDYYITQESKATIKTPPIALSIGYKWMIETTLPAERDWKSGKTRRLTDTLAKQHRLNGLIVSIAPSAAFFTHASPYNEKHPFLDNHKVSHVFVEAGMGYYWHNPDIQADMAFRKYTNSIAAYGYTQKASRISIVCEGYKFFGDYHGFSPFIGPAISYEDMKVTEEGPGSPKTDTYKKGIYPGIAFGWDIRPNRLQAFYLRGNFRYFPGLSVDMPSGGAVHLDALEVNFIQLVVFPGRIF